METKFERVIVENCDFKRKIKISAEVSLSFCPSFEKLISETAGRISLKLGRTLNLYSRLDLGFCRHMKPKDT